MGNREICHGLRYLSSSPQGTNALLASAFKCSVFCSQIALFVISACGFGFPLEWSAPDVTADGKMSSREVITQVSINILLRFAIPSWVYHISRSEK